jgi:hypothetical protein
MRQCCGLLASPEFVCRLVNRRDPTPCFFVSADGSVDILRAARCLKR